MISMRAEGLGKAYRLYRRPSDSLKELLLNRTYSETFWALRDVTLEVAMGGSLGIVGDNGAGKSTLVKLLAGAIAPSTGRVERSGRVTAILSLGAGFHADLSGSENIRIGCAVLGMSPAETAATAPAIADFSELGPFLERPVRTYSAGMKLRLGFSVATAVATEKPRRSFMPAEYVRTGRSRNGPSSEKSAMAGAVAAVSAGDIPRTAQPMRMFSDPERSAWNPAPRLRIAVTRPLRSTRPVLGAIAPASNFTSVDLPAPLSPTMPREPPIATSRVTSRSAQNVSE